MMFSTHDEYLLSVSRDRSWALFQKTTNGNQKHGQFDFNFNFFLFFSGYVLSYNSNSIDKKYKHSRIIWSCCWIPQSYIFITGSRDKSISIWGPKLDLERKDQISEWKNLLVKDDIDKEITAVATTKIDSSTALIAVGK